jgi:hypothetical protein
VYPVYTARKGGDLRHASGRHGAGLQVAIPGGGTTMIKAYLSDTYGYELHDIGRVVGTLVAFSAFFIFMAIVVLRTINFQKR